MNMPSVLRHSRIHRQIIAKQQAAQVFEYSILVADCWSHRELGEIMRECVDPERLLKLTYAMDPLTMGANCRVQVKGRLTWGGKRVSVLKESRVFGPHPNKHGSKQL
ncbi:MAG: hypothetical protein V4730_11810 [Pseudomonadota bacterium]